MLSPFVLEEPKIQGTHLRSIEVGGKFRPIGLFVLRLIGIFRVLVMESKGERTKAAIIERAAGLFNRVGYAAASMSDVMAETGLEKGGIYNHFRSKQELAAAAFQHSAGVAAGRWSDALAGKVGLPAILAMIRTAVEFAQSPPVPGGCPYMNAAVESDHGDPTLLQAVREALDGWEGLLRWHLEAAASTGELNMPDPPAVAATLVAAMGGMFVLEGVFRSGEHAVRIGSQLEAMVTAMKQK